VISAKRYSPGEKQFSGFLAIAVLLQTLSSCTEAGQPMFKYWMGFLSTLTTIAAMAYLDFQVK
jgi:hypothetical protein